jgi:hypothetical protein
MCCFQARLPEIDALQERVAALVAELTQAKTQAEEQGRAAELREKELAEAKAWLESQVRLDCEKEWFTIIIVITITIVIRIRPCHALIIGVSIIILALKFWQH